VIHHSGPGTRLEHELLARERVRTQGEARMAVFDFIEGWYNLATVALSTRLPIAQ
jgi:hypothetical protein